MDSLSDVRKVMAKLTNLPCKGFVSYAGAFETLAMQSVSAEEKLIYEHLHSVSALSYRHGDPPYGPFFVRAGATQSFAVSEERYAVLSSLVDKITDVRLRARVADILWIGSKQLGKENGFRYAKLAVDSFLKIPIVPELWIAENVRWDWERGLRLAKSLGDGAFGSYCAMKTIIGDAFVKACRDDGAKNLLTWGIPRMLDNDDLCDVIPSVTVAKETEALLHGCTDDNRAVDEYCDLASRWYMRANREDDAMRILKLRIENRFKSIVETVSMPKPVWLRLSDMSRNLISFLQAIPGKYRDGYDVDVKILFLKNISALGYNIGMKDVSFYRTPSVDVTQEVARTEDMMRGVRKEDALSKFACLFSLREKEAEALVEWEREECVVPHIMGKCIVRGDKVVARAPAYSERAGSEVRVEMEKVQKAVFLLQSACRMCLYPAYEVLREEHEFAFDDFLGFATASPLVPESHRHIFAEGLLLGWHGRFSASTYMLAPEIENALREQLKFQSCDTTVVDSETRLESEVGLSTLVEKYGGEIKSAFGADFLFEIKVVFCDHAGLNVRNEVAHGLRDDESFNGVVDFYVWWFAIRLLSMRGRTSDDSRNL